MQIYRGSGGVFKVLISLNNVLGFRAIASQQLITVFVVNFAGGVTFSDFCVFAMHSHWGLILEKRYRIHLNT